MSLFSSQIENVVLEIPFSKSVLNVMLSANQGKYSFDPVTKVMTWDVGRIDSTKLPNIRGTVGTGTSRVTSLVTESHKVTPYTQGMLQRNSPAAFSMSKTLKLQSVCLHQIVVDNFLLFF